MANRIVFLALALLLLLGCADFENPGFSYPNTVTLNGDAINESWFASYVQTGNSDTVTSMVLKIYDGQNHEVHTEESTSNQVRWNPIPQDVPVGMYYFVIEYYLAFTPADKRIFWGEFEVVK